jgi:hypothetical protein
LENAKVAQFHWDVAGEAVGNFIKGALDNLKDVVLHHSSFVADRYDDVALRELAHSK